MCQVTAIPILSLEHRIFIELFLVMTTVYSVLEFSVPPSPGYIEDSKEIQGAHRHAVPQVPCAVGLLSTFQKHPILDCCAVSSFLVVRGKPRRNRATPSWRDSRTLRAS